MNIILIFNFFRSKKNELKEEQKQEIEEIKIDEFEVENVEITVDNFKFKIGDSVVVNDGEIDQEFNVSMAGWQGRIAEYYEAEKTCNIKWDSITLRSIPEEILIKSDEEGDDIFSYNLEIGCFSLAQPRDSETDVFEAIDEINDWLSESEDDDEEGFNEDLYEEFEQSSFFKKLSENQKDNAEFAIQVLSDYMQTYYGCSTMKWNVDDFNSCCLDEIPGKITAETDFFEAFGTIIFRYLEFLQAKNYCNTKVLQREITNIRREIVARAKNPQYWHMGKSVHMKANKLGLNLHNPVDLAKFNKIQQEEYQKGLKN